MTEVISIEEYARLTGRSLEDVEAMIVEAEADAITRDMLDPSTLHTFNWTNQTEQKFRDFLNRAKTHA